MGTVSKTIGAPCKVGRTLGLRAKLARSQIRNERQRNDATKAGFGEASPTSNFEDFAVR
ncbi:hypothetical protein SDC9_98451 [bioreactor metagenome]|uniref:Uncharacterized protein n=1 Tax=bioreactor metagenome TaxID=1076179 RepID=A0A645AEW5_9ZZZZ